MDNEHDVPQLSAETFSALQQFYKEQEERENKLRLLAVDSSSLNEDIVIEEDWQLSQFWYDEKTVDILVNTALKAVGPSAKIALVSCPSLYRKIKTKASNDSEIHLFEYDNRFAIYGEDFNLYDYKSPLSISKDKSNYYDLVIADPPFLSDECLTKVAVTVKFLSRDKIILCTGAVMADLAKRLLNLERCTIEPKHKNNLANAFYCYTNFSVDDLN